MELILPCSARWITGRKEGSRVLIDPYSTRLAYKNSKGNKKFYTCIHTKDLDCPVRVTLNSDTDEIIRLSGEHNHDSDLMKEAVHQKYTDAVQNAIDNPTLPNRTSFMDFAANILHDPLTAGAGLPFMPNMRSMARLIQKKRQSVLHMPEVPTKWEDLEMPAEFTTTIDGENFVIIDETVPGTTKKVWGWASNTGISLMQSALEIYGTFEICKSTIFMDLNKNKKTSILVYNM